MFMPPDGPLHNTFFLLGGPYPLAFLPTLTTHSGQATP